MCINLLFVKSVGGQKIFLSHLLESLSVLHAREIEYSVIASYVFCPPNSDSYLLQGSQSLLLSVSK